MVILDDNKSLSNDSQYKSQTDSHDANQLKSHEKYLEKITINSSDEKSGEKKTLNSNEKSDEKSDEIYEENYVKI